MQDTIPIPGFPGYVINEAGEVWSVGCQCPRARGRFGLPRKMSPKMLGANRKVVAYTLIDEAGGRKTKTAMSFLRLAQGER